MTDAALAVRKGGYPAHPFALRVPALDAKTYADLRKSIRDEGLHFPVVLFDGQVIDGVHRQRACREEGVECRYVELEAGKDPEEFSLTSNFARRHVAPIDRARLMLAFWEARSAAAGKSVIPLENRGEKLQLRRKLEEAANVSKSTAERAMAERDAKAAAKARERETKKAKAAADRAAKQAEREAAREAKAKEIADREAAKAAEREAKKAEKAGGRERATADQRYVSWCKEMIRHLSAAKRTFDGIRSLSESVGLADQLRRALAATGEIATVRHGSIADPDVRVEVRSLNALMDVLREYRPIGHLDGQLVSRQVKSQRTKESLAALVPLEGAEDEP